MQDMIHHANIEVESNPLLAGDFGDQLAPKHQPTQIQYQTYRFARSRIELSVVSLVLALRSWIKAAQEVLP